MSTYTRSVNVLENIVKCYKTLNTKKSWQQVCNVNTSAVINRFNNYLNEMFEIKWIKGMWTEW